ncbi:Alpha amylase, catalytic domain containing protein [Histomonas meleagridis]|uniref:Alpha amylase, catalytic domain containing protein n=1 Tax=Histomonas meleagridis TaxID=135588 RepID=UPI00355AB1E5|nr:Alpha amylase, catalytic domain containing protein [Histomonas meleagridis]KAH0798784.1 Alpha amylase, catalytic domain containing protein [Histomonas meleagridis]
MDSKWATHLWNTPKRGTEGWKKGYQDMSTLVGYAQLQYNADHSSYTGLLHVKFVAATGETVELDEIDFIWNVKPLKERTGDYRNGQKGAIVEMFGWPDDDIAEECKVIAEASYLGVKLFPHQEQVMYTQPMENELNAWYFMYQPVSYRLQGGMGTRTQLRNMIKKFRSYGLCVYADAVVNHMSGSGNDAQDHRNPSAGCTY